MTTVNKDRRLGRGLAALLGTPLDEIDSADATPATTPAGKPLASSTTTAAPTKPAPVPNAPWKPAAAAGSNAAPSSASGTGSGSGSASSASSTPQLRVAPFSIAEDPAPVKTGATAKPTATVKNEPAKADSKPDSSPGKPTGTILDLGVYDIDNNPFQPRRVFSEQEIASLAESLKEHQQLQPVLVRKVAGRYQLISGERRLRAAIHAGLQTVRAEVREADDRLVAELAIVENLQRKDLNPIEKAMSFKRYLQEHKCTQDDLARRIKADRSTIANLMRLLELPDAILDSIQKDVLTAGHARALLPLGDDKEQLAFAAQIQAEWWSVREVERRVSEAMQAEEAAESGSAGAASKKATAKLTPQISSLETSLRMSLGTKVDIRQGAKGKGKIIVHFNSPEEFERLKNMMSDSKPAARRAA